MDRTVAKFQLVCPPESSINKAVALLGNVLPMVLQVESNIRYA
jgi:hypothetical protein